MIRGANGLSSKETWFPRKNGPKFPRKHASLGNGPKVMGKPWFWGGKWAQVLKEPLGANGYLSFIGRNFFSGFHSICNLSSIQCNRFYINFSSILCNIFSIFHSQMLHNVDKKLQNGWIIVHFSQNFHSTTWSRGKQVLPPQGSCNSFVFLWQLAWGNYSKITSSISSVHKIKFFWKNNYILDLWSEGRTFNHRTAFFSLERIVQEKYLMH